MRTPQNQFTSLIVVVAALALVGGVVIVLLTSRDSLELAPELWFGAPTAATANTQPPPSPTPTEPPPTASPTPIPPTPTQTLEPTAPPPTPTPTPENTLPEGVTAYARVSSGVTAVRLRDAPNGTVIGALLDGTAVEVLEGLQEVDGVTWVEVRAETGETGWMSAQLLEIVEAPAGPAGPTATALPTLAGGVQGTAVVRLEEGVAARVRDEPGGRVVGGIRDGATVEVLQGRVLLDGITWIEIQDETGLVGWISEQLLVYNSPL